MRLKTKTTLTIIIPIFLAFVLVIGFSSYNMYQKQRVAATTIAEGLSKEYAYQIKAELEGALDTARALSDFASGVVQSGQANRDALDLSLKRILENNPGFYGVWIGFEPNAFDSKDMAYMSKEGHDSTGRYIPYWYRDGGKIARYYLEGYDIAGDGDYYQLSLKSGKEIVMEPFEYEINGQKLMFTSLTVPVVVDGKIVGGAHGAGGEIGHAAVDHEEKEACNCGNCGCLEQYASATGIVRVAQRILAATDEQTVLRKFTKLSAKNVLDAFKEGDKVACDVMAQVGEMLGGTLAMFACVTDPEAIVIGGGVSKAGQPLIDCIQKYYEKYAFTACKKTPIILATLGNDAGIYGSARMVIKEV